MEFIPRVEFLVIVISICSFWFSCGQKELQVDIESVKNNIPIKEEFIDNNVSLSHLIDSVSYIPLETSEYSVIGEITKVIYCNNRFYIQDGLSESVFIFDMDGRFVKKLHNKGKGPYEYTDLLDMFIDNNENLYILGGFKLIKFNLDLEPISQTTLPFGPASVGILDDIWAFTNMGKGHELIVTNQGYSTIFSHVEENGIRRVKNRKPFILSGKEMLFHPSWNDTIFSVNQDKELSYHTIISFDKNLPYEEIKGGKAIDFSEYMCNPFRYCETTNFINFTFDYVYQGDDGPFYTLYSKKTKKTLIYTNQIKNDIYASVYPPLIISEANDDFFVALIKPHLLLDSENKNVLGNQQLSAITYVSNPILALIRFKEF